MARVRFVMLGGFLGAGKTTAVARVGRSYLELGRRVAVVTNDQAFDLVDTHTLRHQGFSVGEVPGACFCCKFDDLIHVARDLSRDCLPDTVIAEPVGSCTDLAATVIEPLRHLYGGDYEVAPFTVLLKPEHGRKILREEAGAGFSPKAAYIFLKQIEEADLVGINKIDKLTPTEVEDLIALVERRFPEKRVFPLSARTGAGFEALLAALAAPRQPPSGSLEIDYDIYAEGEAELGWLNCQASVTAESPFPLDDCLLGLTTDLRDALRAAHLEPAHLKIYGEHAGDAAVANLVGRDVPPELSLASEVSVPAAQLVVNARVAGAPETLEQLVRSSLEHWARGRRLTCEVTGMQRFRPGRPVPTHRM